MTVLSTKSGGQDAGPASRTLRKKALQATTITLLAITLSACGGHKRFAEPGGYVLASHEERHPIQVSQKPVYLDISVPRGASGLTFAQADHIRAFVRQYEAEGTGRMSITTPSGTVNEGAAFEAMKEIRALMEHEGISSQRVDLNPYHDEGDPEPPIKISFTRYVAEAPKCGLWPNNLANSEKNEGFHNFGCAAQRNLAMMVDNPKDLVEPRGRSNRSSERRDLVWDKYVKGESTISQRSSEEQVTISSVGGN